MDNHFWDERYAGTDLIWTAKPNQFLVAEVADLPPGSALDLGCGEGRNAVWLAEHGWAVTGVDFSAVALDKAKHLAESRDVNVDWVLADVVEYVPAPKYFDLVIVVYLHLPPEQRQVAFSRAAAAVAVGGTLLVVGHDRTNPTAGWGGPADPAVLYGPEDVVADLEGLEVLRAERVERQVATDEGPRTAIDVLVRAQRNRNHG